MTIDITSIVTAVFGTIFSILLTIVSTKLIPWLHSKFEDNQLELIKEFVFLAVRAAEQLFDKEQGKEKLEYATTTIITWLNGKGITVDADSLRAMIEAAVLELHKALEE